jgi:hypothetical protein
MHQRTDLAGGMINGDRLLVELVQPAGRPPFVAITWPSAVTVVTPTAYPQTAAIVTRLISESAVALARWKAYGK